VAKTPFFSQCCLFLPVSLNVSRINLMKEGAFLKGFSKMRDQLFKILVNIP
jgi:hypothetical protein